MGGTAAHLGSPSGRRTWVPPLLLVLLMLAEFLLATLGFGQSPEQFIAGFREPHALLGLAGQIGFALMPSWQRGGTID